MSELGQFELNFLKAVEKALSIVPSNLDELSSDLWRCTLSSASNLIRDTAVLINCRHVNNKF